MADPALLPDSSWSLAGGDASRTPFVVITCVFSALSAVNVLMIGLSWWAARNDECRHGLCAALCCCRCVPQAPTAAAAAPPGVASPPNRKRGLIAPPHDPRSVNSTLAATSGSGSPPDSSDDTAAHMPAALRKVTWRSRGYPYFLRRFGLLLVLGESVIALDPFAALGFLPPAVVGEAGFLPTLLVAAFFGGISIWLWFLLSGVFAQLRRPLPQWVVHVLGAVPPVVFVTNWALAAVRSVTWKSTSWPRGIGSLIVGCCSLAYGVPLTYAYVHLHRELTTALERGAAAVAPPLVRVASAGGSPSHANATAAAQQMLLHTTPPVSPGGAGSAGSKYAWANPQSAVASRESAATAGQTTPPGMEHVRGALMLLRTTVGGGVPLAVVFGIAKIYSAVRVLRSGTGDLLPPPSIPVLESIVFGAGYLLISLAAWFALPPGMCGKPRTQRVARVKSTAAEMPGDVLSQRASGAPLAVDAGSVVITGDSPLSPSDGDRKGGGTATASMVRDGPTVALTVRPPPVAAVIELANEAAAQLHSASPVPAHSDATRKRVAAAPALSGPTESASSPPTAARSPTSGHGFVPHSGSGADAASHSPRSP